MSQEFQKWTTGWGLIGGAGSRWGGGEQWGQIGTAIIEQQYKKKENSRTMVQSLWESTAVPQKI